MGYCIIPFSVFIITEIVPLGLKNYYDNLFTQLFIFVVVYYKNLNTVNSRYNQVGYNEITAYNEMEIFPPEH